MTLKERTEPVTLPRRYPPAPLIGVAATIFDDQERVLLVERVRPPRQGLWTLPGGLIDLGEDLLTAVKREIWEECSIEVEIIGLVDVIDLIDRDNEGRVQHHFVIVEYWGRYRSGTLTAGDDAGDARWVSLDLLTRLETTERTEEIVEKAVRIAALDR